MSELSLHGLAKSFGAVKVIEGLNLDINANEFIAFVGPSGCGKSTLLRLIAGLEDVDAGEIRIGGRDVTDLEPVDRDIAMVFQSYALYPHMTVQENMSFGLKVTGTPVPEIRRRVRQAATTLQLEELLSRKPAQLSGGQRQRVAIGRALVRDPKVFLFDEPLSNLDAELRVHMRVEIARLHKALKSTMVYVTHDQVEAMTLADRIVVLQAGRIEQVGTPLELYDDPANLFVAGFIGSPRMNFLSGEVTGASDRGLDIALEGGATGHFALGSSGLAPGQRITLGLRPEHLKLAGEGVRLAARAEMVEHLGVVSYLHALTSESTPLIAELRGRKKIDSVAALDLVFDPDAALVFDADGRRVRAGRGA
jgi:lactose/L-arabinose transport system ATP-binding protein